MSQYLFRIVRAPALSALAAVCLTVSGCSSNSEDLKVCVMVTAKIPQQSIDACTRLIEHPPLFDPENGNWYPARAYHKRIAGDLEGAIADYDEAIRRAPNTPSFYRGRGEVHRMKGDEAGAAKDFAHFERLSASTTRAKQSQ